MWHFQFPTRRRHLPLAGKWGLGGDHYIKAASSFDDLGDIESVLAGKEPPGRVVLDPHERVVEAMRLVFRELRELGSARRVMI